VTVDKNRQSGTGQVVQSSRISVTVGQAAEVVVAVRAVLVMVTLVNVALSGLLVLAWARMEGALPEVQCMSEGKSVQRI
jgi:hypothetical protein